MTPDQEPNKEFFKKFFVHATTKKIRCVDERHAPDQNNGVQIQGATSGLVDAYKHIRHVSEEEAWKAIRAAGIPIDGHVDNHKGVNGCGYNNKVENAPWEVGATESAVAADRVGRVEEARGNLLHYEGEHTPKHATINFMKDQTLNTNGILNNGEGTFNLDAWALEGYAKMLRLNQEESTLFQSHIISSFQATVTTLTHGVITTFTELR